MEKDELQSLNPYVCDNVKFFLTMPCILHLTMSYSTYQTKYKCTNNCLGTLGSLKHWLRLTQYNQARNLQIIFSIFHVKLYSAFPNWVFLFMSYTNLYNVDHSVRGNSLNQLNLAPKETNDSIPKFAWISWVLARQTNLQVCLREKKPSTKCVTA